MALEELKKLKEVELEIFEKVLAGIAHVSDEAKTFAENRLAEIKKELEEIEGQLPPKPVGPEMGNEQNAASTEQPVTDTAHSAEAGNDAGQTQTGDAQTDAEAALDAGGADGASTK